MGFLFSAKKNVPEVKLPDAPSVPDQKALDAEARKKMRDRQRGSLDQSTMLTPSSGLKPANVQTKSLLG